MYYIYEYDNLKQARKSHTKFPNFKEFKNSLSQRIINNVHECMI